MKESTITTSSLVYFQNPNYAGTRTDVAHGDMEVFAPYSSNWTQRSVSVGNPDALRTFIWSMVDVANPNQSYAGHVESYVLNNIPDLENEYPSSQYPLQYVGLDTTLAVPVWVQVHIDSAGEPNAFAATSLINGTATTTTTLVSPQTNGVMGFIGTLEGSAAYVALNCGIYDGASHEVNWQTEGSLTMVYEKGVLTFTGTDLPEGWTFSDPVRQTDGSWICSLSADAVPSGQTITVSAEPDVIADDGVDASILTALVTDTTSGEPVSGIAVTWKSDLGTVEPTTSTTGSDGTARASLTSLVTGDATVTASLASGTSATALVTVTDEPIPSITLFSETNYQGKSKEVKVHREVILRDSLSVWQWKSVKLNGLRLLAYSWVLNEPDDIKDTDFRTYRDIYEVVDSPDLTTDFPQLITIPAVAAVPLDEDDVVIRIMLTSELSEGFVINSPAYYHTYENDILVSACAANRGVSTTGVVHYFNKQRDTIRKLMFIVNMTEDGHQATPYWHGLNISAIWNEDLQYPEVFLYTKDDKEEFPWTFIQGVPVELEKAGSYAVDLTITGYK